MGRGVHSCGTGGARRTADGRRAYLCGINGLATVDTATNTLRATYSGVDLSCTRGDLAITADGSRAYVVSSQSLDVIDIAATSGG